MDTDQLNEPVASPSNQSETTGQISGPSSTVQEEPVVYLEPKPEPKIIEDRKGKDWGWKFLIGGFVSLVFLTFLGFAVFLVTPNKPRRTSLVTSTRESSGYKIPSPKTEIPQTQEEQAVQAISLGNMEEDLKTLDNLMQEL